MRTELHRHMFSHEACVVCDICFIQATLKWLDNSQSYSPKCKFMQINLAVFELLCTKVATTGAPKKEHSAVHLCAQYTCNLPGL